MRALIRRHRRLAVVLLAVGVVVLFGAAMSALAWRTLSRARDQLDAAHSTLEQILQHPDNLASSSGRTQALTELDGVAQESAQAASALQGSHALRIVGLLPGLSTERTGAIELAQDVGSAVRVGTTLLRGVDTLAASTHGTHVSLAAMRSLDTDVSASRTELQKLVRPAGGLWFSLKTTRRSFNNEDEKLVATLGRYRDALTLALEFLGGNGPRAYLLVAENNAEMRDQGSVLSYAPVSASDGELNVGTATTVHDLPLATAVNVPIPAGTERAFSGFEPTQVWQSANATADFSWSGRDLAAMYKESTGTSVNGVIALDVPALSSLLALTGPVSVPELSEPVDASDADYVLLDQLYQGLSRTSSQVARRTTLSDVARAVLQKLSANRVDPVALVRTLAGDAAGRHLLLWDASSPAEADLKELGLSGAVATTDPNRTFHLAVENITATKLDYFVHVSENVNVVIGAGNVATVVTKVTLTNTAPKNPPADSYQFGPDGINSFIAGEYIGGLYYWEPRGSTSYTEGTVPESGLLLTWKVLDVFPQQSASTTFTTIIAHAVQGGRFTLRFVPQPRAVPIALAVHIIDRTAPLVGATTTSTPLSTTRIFSWQVR